MLKRTIKYVDYDGVEREETFYFNLTKAEIVRMESSEDGGMSVNMDRILKSPNGKEIMRYFEEFIKASYGEKSDDGRRFVKSPELSKAFMETPAYDVLFMELVTDAKKAAAFVNSVVPDMKELEEAAKKAQQA